MIRKELVRSSVAETLHALLDKEADELINAQRYERSTDRQGYRSGYCKRNFQTTTSEVELKLPNLKGVPFETAIIECYRRRESSVEEALIEMYLTGVSVRRIEDITEALWGPKVPPGPINNPNKKPTSMSKNGVPARWLAVTLTSISMVLTRSAAGIVRSRTFLFWWPWVSAWTVHFYRNIFPVTPRNKVNRLP